MDLLGKQGSRSDADLRYRIGVGCPNDETLMAMVEHDLPEQRFAELEVHIDSCEHCRKIVAAAASSRELALGTPANEGELAAIEASIDLALGGRYVVEALLGRGGMGTVYLARDKTLGRDVALKLHRAGSGKDRLHREAVAMAKLAHPNVVTVYEIGELEDRMYVAMEYVRGTTLRGWLEGDHLDWRAIVAMVLEAGRGLVAAHEAGLVHRDFKPENVLVGDDGRPRVGDFGLARASSVRESKPSLPNHAALDTPMTQTGTLLGTPAYMAPEQLDGEVVDERCDQFAFSVVAWECLYGKRPFAGGSLVTLQEAITERRFQPIDPKREVPERVRRVLERGLATDPMDRYPDLRGLLADLRAAALPRTLRRAAIAAVGVVVATTTLVAGLSYAHARSRDAACDREGDDVAALFGPFARSRVEVAFARIGSAGAASSFAHAAPVLERVAHGLATRTIAACHASNDEIAAARRTCLDEHTRALSDLVEELEHSDSSTLQYAPVAAWSLRDATECDDTRRLLAEPPPTAKSAPDLAERYGHLQAEVATGRMREARADADALVRDTHARGDRTLELAARRVRGNVIEQTDDAASVAIAFDETLAIAEATGRDSDAAAVLTDRAHLAGVVQHDYALAHRSLTLARAKLERVGGLNLALQSNIDGTEAQILADENRLGEAERAMRAAATQLEQALGAEHPTLGSALGSLSQMLLYQHKTDEALATSRRACAILTAALGEDHPNTAGAHMTNGLIMLELRRFDDARVELQRADATFVHVFGPEHPARVALYGNLGELEALQGHVDAAISNYRMAQQVLERTTGPESPEVADVHADVARVLTLHGHHDEALAELDQTLAILDKSGPAGAPRLIPALIDYAGVQLDRGRPELALPPAERALALAAKLPEDANPSDLADARFALASALWDTGRDRPRARALVLQAKAGRPSPERLATIDAWLAAHR
jgi:tetratricopeptide (TPR) repeat protein/predicted Ser/Thr protein kinase